MEKRILCYGDSNTWGYIGGVGERFAKDVRWTGRLQMLLGNDYTVIEEGLNSRTTVWEDPVEQHKNGYTYLMPCLQSHRPLDLVIIMLGTNDLKRRFHVPARDIAQGAANCAKLALQSGSGHSKGVPKVLLVSPPILGDNLDANYFIETFEPDAVEQSRRFAYWYRTFAEQLGIGFLDAAEYTKTGGGDAVHIDAESHARLAEALFAKIKEMGV